jgi:hypothetical protein
MVLLELEIVHQLYQDKDILVEVAVLVGLE